jgi:hypothetical protein
VAVLSISFAIKKPYAVDDAFHDGFFSRECEEKNNQYERLGGYRQSFENHCQYCHDYSINRHASNWVHISFRFDYVQFPDQ